MKSQAPHNLLEVSSGPDPVAVNQFSLLACGFRPFFLLAGIHAALTIPLWIGLLHGLDLPSPALPATVWHVHEMLYGFVAAAIAGFLLTAVPGWTNRRGYAGAPLAGLVLLWLAGRMAMSVPLGLSPFLVAVLDLAFLPALALMLLPALLGAGNRRNLVFIGVLALLFASNLHFHLNGTVTNAPLLLGMNAMLFLVAMLGGRIIPAFTPAALKQLGLEVRIRRYQLLNRAALFALVGVILVDVFFPAGMLAAAIATVSAVLLAAQLAQWQGHRSLSIPLVWVLHIAYAWLPICLALKAIYLFGLPVPGTSWLHALSVGAMATMIIGVMTRATLGHTGRPLVAPRVVVIGYFLITGAALVRVFGPILLPSAGSLWPVLAATLWCLAFLSYVVVFAPILCRPRIDGRPG